MSITPDGSKWHIEQPEEEQEYFLDECLEALMRKTQPGSSLYIHVLTEEIIAVGILKIGIGPSETEDVSVTGEGLNTVMNKLVRKLYQEGEYAEEVARPGTQSQGTGEK